METWSLEHPEHGTITLECGYDDEFRDLYPDWPGEEQLTTPPPTREATILERARWRFSGNTVRLQLSLDGEILSRYGDADEKAIPLKKAEDPHKFQLMGTVSRTQPRVTVDSNTLREVIHVTYRDEDTVVQFEPPAGSRAAKRAASLESSPVKRALFPMLSGLGKAGWAIAVFILAPILGRLLRPVIEWLARLFPDFTIPPLPDLYLPVPNFPALYLPVPHLNVPPLPELPAWVDTVMEYRKMWLPIVIGIGVGIIALRNYRRSEETKKKWQADRPAT